MTLRETQSDSGQHLEAVGCVRFAIGLFALAFVIGAVQVGRIGIQLTRLGPESNLAHAQRESLVNRWLGWYSAVLVILAGAVADMVFKPGL